MALCAAARALPSKSAVVIFRASKAEVRMDDERRRVTVVLDRDIADAVERVAERERGSLSGACRRGAGRERAQAAA
jgi:hypothetical protein